MKRIQNPMLWRRFALRRQELINKTGRDSQGETLLFLGTDKMTMQAIVNEGFDMRVSNAGSMGRGECCFHDEQAASPTLTTLYAAN